MKLLFILLGAFLSLNASNVVLIDEDFETALSSDWEIETGFIQTSDAQNGVLKSTDNSFISYAGNFGDYNLSLDFKLIDASTIFHINMFVSGSKRYFFGVGSFGFYLQQQIDESTFVELNPNIPANVTLNTYHNLKIAHEGKTISLYFNNTRLYTYTADELESRQGSISFEGLSQNIFYIDNLSMISNEELVLSSESWVNLGGPIGGIGYDIKFNPQNTNIMYVTDNNLGVSKSIDRGKNWIRKNNGINIKGGVTRDNINIFSLNIDQNNPNTIWAGTQGSGKTFGIFKSTDAAENWSTKINGISLKEGEESLVVRGFTIQNAKSDTVYVQTEIGTSERGREFAKSKGRVYKTTDGGENWDEILEVNSLTRYLIIDPNDSKTLYVSTGIFDVEAVNGNCENGIDDVLNRGGEGILKSTDAGLTWSSINVGLDDLYVGTLRMDPNNSQILYAGVGNNACSIREFVSENKTGLYKSINGGATWTQVIRDNIISAVNISPQNSNIVYAGSDGGFYSSTDSGDTWNTYVKNTGSGFGPDGVYAGFPIDLVVDPQDTNTIYVNNYGGGVIKSTDAGKTWIIWSNGMSGSTISKLHVNKTQTKKLYSIGRSGPFISDDNGENFRGIANFSSLAEYDRIVSSPSDANIILLSSEFDGSIQRSSDNGKTFMEVLKHPQADNGSIEDRSGFKAISFSPSDSNIVIAGISSDKTLQDDGIRPTKGIALYKSVDAGITFKSLSSSVDSYSVNEILFDPTNSNKFLVATSKGIFSTTNAGQSFTRTLSSFWIEDISISSSGTVVIGAVDKGIYTSSDFGKTWAGPYTSGLPNGTPYISSVIYDDIDESILYTSDYYSGVYKSTDGGKSWSAYPDYKMSGLDNKAVVDLVSSSGLLYAGTEGGGIFRFGELSLAPSLPDVELLDQNDVAKLYVATFNRAPDKGGLDYWVSSGLSLSEVAQSFFVQPETLSLYPESATNRDFINSVYQNLFNRAPDTLGWDYWENELNIGSFTKNSFIQAVINGAQDDDVIILNNKTEVGVAFSDAGLSDLSDARSIMQNVSKDTSSVSDARGYISSGNIPQ